ncbi:MAG: hypothetical protein LC650_01215 [Actinobacteria bacterium]|nr:hypothetical protein [Actinomycetota bacterium]
MRDPVMMPDGDLYRYIWHNDWIEVGGSIVVQVVRLDDKGYKLEPDMMASFPAAQVLGFVVTSDPPEVYYEHIYYIERNQ